MNREFNNKQDFILYILEELNKKPAPIAFGDFFMEIGPSFGIDGFRDLMEELYQQGLLTKLESPGRIVPSLGFRTVDLRFGISVSGIEYLKNNNKLMGIKAEETKQEHISVFVTYSWDNPEHEEKVHAFTNMLRDNGFHAEVDKMLIQSETAKDFKIMMHRGMTDYKKVIVVLSEGYKEKVEEFKGGVGTEYSLILKDIEDNPTKYILVTFSGREKSTIPLFFKDREIISLKDNDDSEKQKLFSKLLDEKIYEFNEVANKLPEIKKVKAPDFFSSTNSDEINKSLIEIQDLTIAQDNASYLYQKIKYIELVLSVGFKNVDSTPLNDYTVEVYYPKETISFEVDGRIEGDYKVVTIDNNIRIFPQQLRVLNLEKLILRNYTIGNIIDKSIIVKIYSDKGTFEKQFPLTEFVIKNHFNHMSEQLSVELFLENEY